MTNLNQKFQAISEAKKIMQDLYDFFEPRWYRRSTLLILLGIVVAVSLFLSSSINLNSISITNWAMAGAVALATTGIWYFTSRPPKNPKGKIGFGIAIKTESKEQNDRIVSDFIMTLRSLLQSRNYRYKFSFIVFPKHFAEQIQDRDTAYEFMRSSHLHFLIYGRARTRVVKNVPNYFLNLEGIVTHKEVDQNTKQSFSAEFGDLFPRRIQISNENDIFSFEITAEIINYVARYVMGIAALLSGDSAYSQEVFEDLDRQLMLVKLDIPAITKIRQRIPYRLSDAYYLQALKYFDEWFKTKKKETLLKAKPFLDKQKSVDPNSYSGHLIRSSWLFIAEKNIKEAKNEVIKCKKDSNQIWRYNYAFLLAYEGDLNKATKEYQLAFKRKIPNRPLNEILSFIPWVLKEEPDKTQFYFCLGLLYYFIQDDKRKALDAFEKFINKVPEDKFQEQVKLSKGYINKIKARK